MQLCVFQNEEDRARRCRSRVRGGLPPRGGRGVLGGTELPGAVRRRPQDPAYHLHAVHPR